jgi:DNA modification methylase
VKEDDFDPDAHYETKVKAGEVWQLGEHRLMCGDSTDADAVAKLMNGERADLVFTDPPYGYKYESNKPRQGGKNYDMIMNDDKILDFFPVVIPHCSGWIFVCTTWKVLDIWMPLFKKYLELTNMVVWDKGGGGMGDLKKTFYTDHEIILTANQGNEFYGNRIGSVWNFQTDVPSSYLHPTQKPVKLSACAIEKTTREGEIVLDVFGGSGSTMIACEQLGRKCRMMELDPHYCTVIIARWEKLTGQKAIIEQLNQNK